jgi:hypothetical protein
MGRENILIKKKLIFFKSRENILIRKKFKVSSNYEISHKEKTFGPHGPLKTPVPMISNFFSHEG